MPGRKFDPFSPDDSPDPDFSDEAVGIVIPAAMAFLGMSFLGCALLITGLPPLSGFVGKLLILSATLDAAPDNAPGSVPASIWMLWGAILGSSLIGIVALSRMGVRLFWSSEEIVTPRLHLTEAGPVAALLLSSFALVAGTGPAMDYLGRAGESLSAPQAYIDAVLNTHAPPVSTGKIDQGGT